MSNTKTTTLNSNGYKNIRVINPFTGSDVITNIEATNNAIDGSHLIACPAFIDMYCELRDICAEDHSDIYDTLIAATKAGFSHIACMPNTLPHIDTPAVAALVQDITQQADHCTVNVVAALTENLDGAQLAEMGALKASGCIAVTNLRQPMTSNKLLLQALQYAATFELPVFFYPQDHSLAEGGCAHDGATATRLGLNPIPSAAETIALSRDLLLVKQTGLRAHFGCLSCADSVELIRQAKQQGLPITADTSIHHLLNTDQQLEDFDSNFHFIPPLRSESDRQALLEGLRDGTLDAICSMHQPNSEAAKLMPFPASAPGRSTYPSFLSMLRSLQQHNELEWTLIIEKLTIGPAACLGISPELDPYFIFDTRD